MLPASCQQPMTGGPRQAPPTRADALSQSQEERARLSVERVLQGEPEEFGLSGRNGRTGWTLPMLVECLKHRYGIAVSRQTVRRMLAAMGYSWQHRRFMRADLRTNCPN